MLSKLPALLLIIISLALIFNCSSDDVGDSSSSAGSLSSSSSSSWGGEGSFVDKGNDISNYGTVTIGNQVWMAENLNYAVDGSKCYGEGGQVYIDDEFVTISDEEIQDNCNKYGRLYNWEAAMSACPIGWHLPSVAEWDELTSYIETDKSCTDCEAAYLKSTNSWYENGNGQDAYGFMALPGGYGYSVGSNFGGEGNYGNWWSAYESDNNYAYYRYIIYYGEYMNWSYNLKNYLRSVRCVRDL